MSRKALKTEVRSQISEVCGIIAARAVAAHLRFRLEWNVASDEFPQIEFSAGVIDIDSGQIAFGVVIQNDTYGNFLALNARLLRKIDVKRIGLGKIIHF